MKEEKTQKCSGNTKPRTQRSRTWCLTMWDVPVFNEKQMSYLVYGKETCPTTGRLHYQTFVRFYNAKEFSAVKKTFGNDAHIEVTKGSNDENIAYCTKDGDYVEFGNRPKQGRRTDLEEIARDISDGTTVDSIALTNPTVYHQYGRTLNKLEDLRMRRLFRTTMTTGVWYYGSTGTGKSHQAFEGFSPDTHYVLPNDRGWWDGYVQQDIVIINDFRGHLSYDFMLQLVDKWPFSVPRRGREPMPFISKKVIVTSSLSPHEVYNRREQNDSIKQLLRRFEIICLDEEITIEDDTMHRGLDRPRSLADRPPRMIIAPWE